MNILIRSKRLRRSLSLALTFILCGCAAPFLPTAANSFAASMPGQKQTSRDRAGNRENDDDTFARPRRIEPQSGAAGHGSAEGPIIRVALVTNVTSVTVGSSSGMILRRAENARDSKKIASGSLRVELRRQREPAKALRHNQPELCVRAATRREARDARKIADELKKKFFEPVTVTFDEKQRVHAVLIGRFASRSEAQRLVERLRKAGYDDPRIETEGVADPVADSVTDTNARSAKSRAQPGHTERASAWPDYRAAGMAAIVSDKIVASSDDELIITPAASAAVRVGGKDYRGSIHLVLNPRGRINVVNALPLEEYLRGVVPLELPPGAYPEIEALKAQAIAARSYALVRLGRHRDEGYDLVDDARAQVYGGITAERELSNRAISETRGIAAVFPNEEGKLEPIEALYTANCGGRTENNEEVFGGKPMPYLRSVACSLDRQSLSGRDIVTNRTPEPLTGTDGRSIAREVALLSVLGFSLPRHTTASYLRGSADRDEVREWAYQTARFAGKEKPDSNRSDVTRLAEFARLAAASIYGEGRASTLLAPADVDYLLGSLRVEQLPREARSDVAMLLANGILHLPPDAVLNGRATITRGQAIETLARGLLSKSQMRNDPHAGSVRSQDSGVSIPHFKSEISAAAQKGRLVIAEPGPTRGAASQKSRFTSVNTSRTGSLTRPVKAEPHEATPHSAGAVRITTQDGLHGYETANGFAIAEGAWLFRAMGGESYAVERLTLIGGERVSYHLNAAGKVDFLEATTSGGGASSDRFSSMAEWQERVTLDDLTRRLARSRINVGRLENIEPVTFSSSRRVTEVEITGDEGHARLGRPQLRGALGLKENLFVVDRETDARGRIVAFVFTGRGWGHGVGMCQTGAYGLAKDGYSYTAILRKYYTGVKLQKMY